MPVSTTDALQFGKLGDCLSGREEKSENLVRQSLLHDPTHVLFCNLFVENEQGRAENILHYWLVVTGVNISLLAKCAGHNTTQYIYCCMAECNNAIVIITATS